MIFRVDDNAQSLYIDDTEILLSIAEFAAVTKLLKAKGQVVYNEQLCQAMFGNDWPISGIKGMQVVICRIRIKIKKACEITDLIETRHLLGYRINKRYVDYV